jgi:hypothetical protein
VIKLFNKEIMTLHLARILFWLCLPVSWLWSLGALLHFPELSKPARVSLTVSWGILSLFALIFVPVWSSKIFFLLAGVFLIWFLLQSLTPQIDRDWAPEQEETAIAIFNDDDTVTIQNIRDWHYHTENSEIHWIEKNYDLTQITSADYIVVPFASWRGLAHVFVTFGFSNGEHLAISVEARRKQGVEYAPLSGIYRNFETIYVIGLERDLLGLRSNFQENPVHVYPLKAEPEPLRKIFISLVKEATALAAQPVFYHTLTNTCTSNLFLHSNAVMNAHISMFDWRLIFPGYSDQAALEKGLIDTTLNIDQARKNFLINDRSQWHDDEVEWSKQIRKG